VKKKDVMYLALAVVIFLAAGYLGYTQLLGKKAPISSTGVSVEVVGPLPDSFDDGVLTQMTDRTKNRDFNSPVDLSGLNNTAPFGH